MKDRQRQVKYVALDAFRAASATPSGLTDLAASLGTKPETLAVRAAFPVELVKDADPAAPVSFVISTETPDREKDSIKVDGWELGAFRRSPTVLFAHDYSSLPVGRAPDIHVADGKLKSGPITFVPAEVYPFAETVHQMVRLGFLNAASVGFRPLKSSWNEERRGVDFEKQELLEFSLVPVPANAECLIEARAAGIDVEPLREWAERTLERLDGDTVVKSTAGAAILSASRTDTVAKRGRVLSAANEGKLRQAQGILAEVIAQVESAPEVEPEPEAAPAAAAVVPVAKPYPNEHSCRLRSPDDFQDGSFRRMEREHDGKTYAVIMGKLAGEDSMTEQAYRYPKDAWTAASAGAHCKSHDGAFEAASGAAALVVIDDDPLRWNRQLSKAFDVSSERMEPASAEYAWVSRYLEAEVKDLHHGGTFVPSFRMGSFLSALDDTLYGWTVDAIRNMTDRGSEAPPYYETIRLNSTKAREFLVEGIRFMRRSDGAKCVMKVEPQWYGLNVTTYTRTEQREVSGQLLAFTWERAKQLNFLKGEAFSLGGEFLERTGETWGDLFLDEKSLAPIQRAATLLIEKGAALDSRGILLAGPPGTGKTLAGRVLMNQTPGTTFLWLAARDFYRAGAFGGLTSAFDLAEECAPTILFIEDIDSWIDSYSVDLLKTEMDGIKRRSGIVTILTSNFPHRLPEALIDRPGRFHDVLELTLPGATVRAAMLDAWLPDVTAATRADLAGATGGFSGAHLRELVKLAQILRDEQGIDLAAAVTQALAKIRDQRALIDRLRQDARKYLPSRAAQLTVSRTVLKTATDLLAARQATASESVLDVEDEALEFDLGAISAEEEDEFKGLKPADVLAALRDVIAAEASDGIRKAINSALGRVD